MNERVLCVDDDPNVLQAYQRTLRKRFPIDIALGGEEALEIVGCDSSYAVIVSDMRMPAMNGVELLKQVKQIAPNMVRMMLTGNSDQQTALDAVNDGHVFRFMTKPCPPNVFAKALQAGIEQHHLIVAEQELLSKTLSGSVQVLTDVLTLVNPTAFGRAGRVQRLARDICRVLKYDNAWLVNLAAMLSQIGCVAVPENILEKISRAEELTRPEREVYHSHPEVAMGPSRPHSAAQSSCRSCLLPGKTLQWRWFSRRQCGRRIDSVGSPHPEGGPRLRFAPIRRSPG